MSINKEKSTNTKVGAVLSRGTARLSDFLTVLFCALRACDVIDWQWYWVISPIIISWVIAFVAFAIAGVISYVVSNEGVVYED